MTAAVIRDDRGEPGADRPTVRNRLRVYFVVGACLSQAALLWLFFPNSPRVEADNTRYEEAGYRLAAGEGLSLSFSTLADLDVRDWACARHPDRCQRGDVYPTAAYPPGYQIFIGLVYFMAGRNIATLLVIQGLLHLILIVFFESILFRVAGKPGYLFAMAVAAVYPFLARQAGMVMSDHLHAVLLTASIWALFSVTTPSLRYGLAGFLFALATLTRPYSFVALPVLLLPIVRRSFLPGRLAVMAFLLSLSLPFGAWWLRNLDTFGRFIPFTTTGIGAGLYLNKTEWTVGSALDGDNASRIYNELNDVSGDITTWAGDRRLRTAAIEWMAENPTLVLRSLPKRVFRSWISMGYQGTGLHPAALGNILFSGGLLLLGVLGLVLRMRGLLVFPGVIIIAYWGFLLHTPSEARRTLALRLPMLVFAALAVDEAASRVKRARSRREDPVDDKLGATPGGVEGPPDVLADQAK